MSVLPIRIYGDPVLRCRAALVPEITDDIRTLAGDMCETMYAAPGRGLAAPQVGRLVRMFVMDCHWKDGEDRAPVVMINPRVLATSTEQRSFDEGCLSIPDVVVPVERPAQVTFAWTDLDGTPREKAFEGIGAVCAQHEYDHLDGILNVDRMTPTARALIDDQLAAFSG